MSLRSSIAKLQRTGTKLYLKISEHFNENLLIQGVWRDLGRDLAHQSQALRALRPTFWEQLEKEEKAILAGIRDTSSGFETDNSKEPGYWSLHNCFIRTLNFTEPFIIKVYAPLVLGLKKTKRANHSLDFYVIVNAHVTRLARLVREFSGDPALIQRCTSLILQFERETQEIVEPPPLITKRKRRSVVKRKLTTVARKKTAPRPVVTQRKRSTMKRGTKPLRRTTSKRSRPLAKRVKRLAKQAKSRSKNVNLQRRHARR